MVRKPSPLLVLTLALVAAVPATAAPPKVSEFGKYSGYSEAVYDGWVRSSQYLPMRDGTRLAVDIVRPTLHGKVATERLPVVWTHHRYQRAFFDFDGLKVYSMADAEDWLGEVVRHGYVVAAVDVRGSGASFGTYMGWFSSEETRDSYDVTEWLAAQPWSNGNVGMYSRSYLGFTQYLAASQKPPHLKAIFPEVAGTDVYELIYRGGIFHGRFIEAWSNIVRQLDNDPLMVPVDEDRDRSLLKAALEQHRSNRSVAFILAGLPFRDDVDPRTGVSVYRDWTPITYLSQIRESRIPVYHLAGWYDRYVRDQTILFNNLDQPQRLSIGPWTHTMMTHFDFAAEHLRWWDYWLKGIDNGILKEDPVHYYVVGAPEATAWRSARSWPLPTEKRTPFWMGPRRSLDRVAPTDTRGLKDSPDGRDELKVDYSVTVSPDPRWGLDEVIPEMSAHDAKSLTWTTPPLPAAVEVTGHPVAHLWISSSAADADVFVYLEEVDPDGKAHYVSEGMLRASNRATGDPGYNTIGLPYHPGLRHDQKPLVPGEPVELAIDLYPTSRLFAAGHRIRITVAGADWENARTPRLTPAPTLTVWRQPGRASWVDLPVIDSPSE
jgi:putative CocE/NonD family hydrolase